MVAGIHPAHPTDIWSCSKRPRLNINPWQVFPQFCSWPSQDGKVRCNSLNPNSCRQEAVTQYDEKKFEPDAPDLEQKEVALLQKRSLHSQSTSGSTETVVEASPIGKKGQSSKKRPDNLDVGIGAVTAGMKGVCFIL